MPWAAETLYRAFQDKVAELIPLSNALPRRKKYAQGRHMIGGEKLKSQDPHEPYMPKHQKQRSRTLASGLRKLFSRSIHILFGRWRQLLGGQVGEGRNGHVPVRVSDGPPSHKPGQHPEHSQTAAARVYTRSGRRGQPTRTLHHITDNGGSTCTVSE